MDDKRQITHEGEIKLGDNTIPCYVLEDGTRILSSHGMQRSLLLSETRADSGSRLGEILSQKTLEPFIYKEKTQAEYRPLECYKGNQKISGYEVTVLADICEAFLEARNSITLSSRQQRVADQCEILMRGFARVGLVALVDEATGYQYDRERFELQKILNAYVSDEILKWQLTFTDEFYREIFRLWGIPFIPKYIRAKPSFIGKLTVKYIYDQLPKGVFEKISEITPKGKKGYKYRLHQSLTEDIGRKHLVKQIHEVTTLMSISDSKEQFNALFQKKYADFVQLEMEFEENADSELSDFDKNLKRALEYKE